MAKRDTKDTAIIISDDSELCEILEVREQIGNDLYCGEHILPIDDASLVKIGMEGRVYFYNCSLPYINEIQHLAEVEKNLVINKALVFAGEINEKKSVSFFWYFVAVMLSIILIFAVLN